MFIWALTTTASLCPPSESCQDVIILSYSRLLYWLPSTVSHKGWLCGSLSPPALTYKGFTERGSLKVSGTRNNEISVEARWRHDSWAELAKQSALSWSFFPAGVHGWWRYRFALWKLNLQTHLFNVEIQIGKRRVLVLAINQNGNTVIWQLYIKKLFISTGHS